MSQVLLCWKEPRYALIARDRQGSVQRRTGRSIVRSRRQCSFEVCDVREVQNELLLRSTEILFRFEPASSVRRTFPVPFFAPEGEIAAGPAWPHTHTLDVAGDDVLVRTAHGICRLDVVTITGFLRWERSATRGQYYVMERVPGGDAFAAALIATELREGHMTCLVFSAKTRRDWYSLCPLSEKHLNAIRRLKVDIPARTVVA